MPASKLAVYRRKKGLTQEQLAELSGVTSRTIQRIENGTVVPHIQTLKMLADRLDIDVEALMDAPEGNPINTNTPKTELLPFFHLLALVGLFLPILNIIFPFAFWLAKKGENPEYDKQGKQVLNFHLTMSMAFFSFIALMVFFFPAGFPLFIITYGFMFIMTAINLYRSIKLQPIKYPLSAGFFKV